MINLAKITEKLNELLNAQANGYSYLVYSDAELHRAPTRNGNTVETVIEGISTLINSSIVPVTGLKIGTQTIGVSLAIPIDTRGMQDITQGISKIVERYKEDIDTVVSTPQTFSIEGILCNLVGTLAEVGDVEQKSSIGVMVEISFTITLNYFANGVNSTNQKLYYVVDGANEEIPFTSLSIGRNVVQDGGAFSNSKGIAKNYVQTTALAMEFTMPALMDNKFCELFRRWLLKGNSDKFTIKYNNGYGEDKADSWEVYEMIFLTSNLQAQGVDNVGYTISLAEAL